MDNVCKHGIKLGHGNDHMTGIAMSAPWDHCKCCDSDFYYIDSATYSFDYNESRTHTAGLCFACGGEYTTMVNGQIVGPKKELGFLNG